MCGWLTLRMTVDGRGQVRLDGAELLHIGQERNQICTQLCAGARIAEGLVQRSTLMLLLREFHVTSAGAPTEVAEITRTIGTLNSERKSGKGKVTVGHGSRKRLGPLRSEGWQMQLVMLGG